jgi:hypothetical protein
LRFRAPLQVKSSQGIAEKWTLSSLKVRVNKPVVVCILSISAKAFAVKISKSGLNSIKKIQNYRRFDLLLPKH